MYQNKHSGHNNQSKDNVSDLLDRIKDEFNGLRSQLQNSRHEMEKQAHDREAFHRQYYEMIYTTQLEIAKQAEISKRLSGLLQHVIQFVPADQQPNILSAMERAKNVTPQDIMNPMQQFPNSLPMLPNMGQMGAMLPPGLNPFLAAMNLKPEDLNAMAASFGMKNLPMMPPMPNPLAALNATTSQAHSIHNNNNNSSSTNLSTSNQADNNLNNSRAASTSRPHSATGTPVSKRPKTDLDDDGELEIDVQNDDAGSSARPSSTTHANGTSHKKSGRESAQSMSSRDSSATPKSKQNMNQQAAMAAAMASLMPGQDLNALLGMTGLGGNSNFMDASRRICAVSAVQANGKPPYAYKIVNGGTPHPVQFPDDALTGPDIPKNLKRVADLHHDEVVCAVTIAPENDKVYTGGHGCVKVWDISKPGETTKLELTKIDCGIGENYVRSCKLLNNDTLLVGGESPFISVIDLTAGKVLHKLDSDAQACYALVISKDGRQCYACCADGNIIIWDLVTYERIATLKGHEEGASCVDLSSDGKTLWTGGLDNAVCTWDIAEQKRLQKYELDSQVFSLGCSPTDDFVAVGMENSKVEMLSTKATEKYVLHEHENCVLSLKFAHNGPWFVSTGKDSSLVTWRSPYGARLVKTQEKTSVLASDISTNDKFIVTGSGDKRATLYEVSF